MPFVLDNSVSVSWYLPDEDSEYARSVLRRLGGDRAIVPAIWSFEITNTLVNAQRRRRISDQERTQAVAILTTLPITIHIRPNVWMLTKVLDLALQQGLSAYDAAYLDLAMVENLPLATLDTDLRAAAERVGVDLV